MAKFSLRIVDADYYLTKPIPDLDVTHSSCRQRDVVRVPIIRIFGSTPQGQKCCLHLHNIFPYFYVLVPKDEVSPMEFGKRFASSLDMAIQISLGKAVSKQQEYVYSYEIVQKIPMYGYHHKENMFLKVFLFNPGLINKVSDLLVNGSVMNQFFQPYETHIPYLLQFFIDYNLHGMNLINLNHILFRKPLPQGKSSSNDKDSNGLKSPNRSVLGSPTFSQTNYDIFTNDTVMSMNLLSDGISKQSTCQLECDALENYILNKNFGQDSNVFNPGLKSIWDDEKQRRRLNHESSIIELPSSEDRSQFGLTENEKYQLLCIQSHVTERIALMGEQLSESLNTSHSQSVDNNSKNTSFNNSISSTDETLLDILVDMATTECEEESTTPFLETTLINNGLREEHEEKENLTEDEDNEAVVMSQTIHGEKAVTMHLDDDKEEENEEKNDSWTDSFIWEIPQLESKEQTESNRDKKIPQLDGNFDDSCASLSDSFEMDSYEFKSKEKSNVCCKRIPQIDGNCDDSGPSSSDDFKEKSFFSPTTRKKKKKLQYKQINSSQIKVEPESSNFVSIPSTYPLKQTFTRVHTKSSSKRKVGYATKELNKRVKIEEFEVSKQSCITEDQCGLTTNSRKCAEIEGNCKKKDEMFKEGIDYKAKYNLKECKVLLIDIEKNPCELGKRLTALSESYRKAVSPKPSPKSTRTRLFNTRRRKRKLKMKFKRSESGSYVIKSSPTIMALATEGSVCSSDSIEDSNSQFREEIKENVAIDETSVVRKFVPNDIETFDVKFLIDPAKDFQEALQQLSFHSPERSPDHSNVFENCHPLSPCFSSTSEEFEYLDRSIENIVESPLGCLVDDVEDALPDVLELHKLTPKKIPKPQNKRLLQYGSDQHNVYVPDTDSLFMNSQLNSGSSLEIQETSHDRDHGIQNDLLCTTVVSSSQRTTDDIDNAYTKETLSYTLDGDSVILANDEVQKMQKLEESTQGKTLVDKHEKIDIRFSKGNRKCENVHKVKDQKLAKENETYKDTEIVTIEDKNELEMSSQNYKSSQIENISGCKPSEILSNIESQNDKNSFCNPSVPDEESKSSIDAIDIKENENSLSSKFPKLSDAQTHESVEAFEHLSSDKVSPNPAIIGNENTKDTEPVSSLSSTSDNQYSKTKDVVITNETSSSVVNSPKSGEIIKNGGTGLNKPASAICTFLIRFDSDSSTLTRSESTEKEQQVIVDDFEDKKIESSIETDLHQPEDLISPLMYDQQSRFSFTNKGVNDEGGEGVNENDDGVDDYDIHSGDFELNSESSNQLSPRFVDSQEYENIHNYVPPSSDKVTKTKVEKVTITPVSKPPTRQEVLDSLHTHDLNEMKHKQAFFGNDKDTTDCLNTFHGQHAVQCKDKMGNLAKCITDSPSQGALEHFQLEQITRLGLNTNGDCRNVDIDKTYKFLYGTDHIVITPCKPAPKPSKIKGWLKKKNEQKKLKKKKIENKIPRFISPISTTPCSSKKPTGTFNISHILNHSDIEGMTPDNTFSFDHTQANLNDAKALHINQHLTVISVETFCKTRRTLKPDPQIDPINAIFYATTNETPDNSPIETGVFVLNPSQDDEVAANNFMKKSGITMTSIKCFKNEKDMLLEFALFIKLIDPDIILGYEVQMLSWGYIIERGACLDLNMCHLFSRITDKDTLPKSANNETPENWFGQLTNMTITGRIILNVWRVMRSEVTLQIYSYENVTYHVLHRRVPFFSHQTLTNWWCDDTQRWRVFQYYSNRCQGNLDLLESIDFINRTSELARVFGILFYAVISRGSQFRVESMMLRTAKPLNYVPVSPSVHQRAKMPAPECIPLVLEPESKFYVDPVIVLDFQSLYPSIIIAYNYCYSTCLGKVNSFLYNENYKFGATSLNLSLKVLKKLTKDKIHITPNGVGFVTADVKRGVLPRMLEDILNTRIMVKGAMKKAKKDKVLHRMLDSRQLGLKLIANVTYGYTSANFSGRMPCIEIGDSVVRKARETLERAIHLVNTTQKWNAKVVYGDTDSMFIMVKGASKERAFQIGQEIVNEVTAANPKPVKLKFEKVYQPCVLITKKRYVGYSYETLDQKEPIFDAKGIETVRRDNCPAVGKILEKSIRVLFESKDVSLVKKYVQRQLMKIMSGKAFLKEFVIAKEYRGMNNYKPGACVPALVLTRKMLKQDRRSEPRIGQRVPYVIIHGSPGLPLIQLVRSPMELIDNPGLRINEVYYITKQICPALSRIFSLLGINVGKWFTDLPKVNRIQDREIDHLNSRKDTISHYFNSQHCPVCQQLTTTKLCSNCRSKPQETIIYLSNKIWNIEKRNLNLRKICQHCTSSWSTNIECLSLDCPVFFKFTDNKKDMNYTNSLRIVLDELSV